MFRRFLWALLALYATAALSAVATTKVTLSSTAWTDLGAGPLMLNPGPASSVVYAIGDVAPTIALQSGFPLYPNVNQVVNTASHVWAMGATSVAASVFVSPIIGASGGGGGGGVSTVNTTCPASSNTGSTITLNGGLQLTTRSPVSGASDTLLTGDCGQATRYTGTGTTVTVPAAGSTGFGSNWATSLVNAGTGVITLNSSGGNFSQNGTIHLSMAAGQSVMLQTDGTNWNVISNPQPAATTLAPTPTPGSIRYYPLYSSQTAAGAGQVSGTTYCSPFWMQSAQHWDQLITYVSTVFATGHSALAFYNDAVDGTGVHYPQNMQVNSGSVLDPGAAGAGTYTMPTYQIPQGLNWFCFQVDNTTSRYLSFIGIGAAGYVGGLIGSSLVAHIVGSGGAAMFGYSYTGGTYGTWPANTGAGADIQNATVPYLGYRVLSAP